MSASVVRRVRADAARNAQRIVRAAREVFAELGADAQLEEIARRAGVGGATLYRHFASKDELIRAIFRQRFAEQVEPAVRRAVDDADPWRAIVTVLEAALTAAEQERATYAAMRDPASVVAELASQFFPAFAVIVLRAQAAGLVRDDLRPDDLPRLTMMVISTVSPTAPEQDWRRSLALLLDALRPTAATPLPPAPRRPDPAGG